MDLHHLKTEATTVLLNIFIQHYATETLLGAYLTTLIENLQLKLGVTRYLFAYNYNVWNGLATDSWVKTLWESIHKFDCYLELVETIIPLKYLLFATPPQQLLIFPKI